jgi:probable HAF family extracellular repeat protein
LTADLFLSKLGVFCSDQIQAERGSVCCDFFNRHFARDQTMKPTIVILFVVLSFLFSIPVQADVQYTVLDLGIVVGFPSPSAINNSGQVVGGYYANGLYTAAFRTAANQPINRSTDDLGVLGGSTSYACGINNLGQAVGSSVVSSGGYNAFRTATNMPINPTTDGLGTLGGMRSVAFGINDNGQVVGNSTTNGDLAEHAFRTAPNMSINPITDDLGTLGGWNSYAYGINNTGQVAGYSETSGGDEHAFRTAANQLINPDTDDLGTLGGTGSPAYSINEIGQVVGQANTSGNANGHAFRTAANQSINSITDDLGTLGGTNSCAYSINNNGIVVGDSDIAGDGGHAFVYIGNGPMQDLNNLIEPMPGWTLGSARGINDFGQIVCYAGFVNGNQLSPPHAFLLTPVPEPSTLALLGIGFLSFIAFIWRRAT